jgi:hypothetical protein
VSEDRKDTERIGREEEREEDHDHKRLYVWREHFLSVWCGLFSHFGGTVHVVFVGYQGQRQVWERKRKSCQRSGLHGTASRHWTWTMGFIAHGWNQ